MEPSYSNKILAWSLKKTNLTPFLLIVLYFKNNDSVEHVNSSAECKQYSWMWSRVVNSRVM